MSAESSRRGSSVSAWIGRFAPASCGADSQSLATNEESAERRGALSDEDATGFMDDSMRNCGRGLEGWSGGRRARARAHAEEACFATTRQLIALPHLPVEECGKRYAESGPFACSSPTAAGLTRPYPCRLSAVSGSS